MLILMTPIDINVLELGSCQCFKSFSLSMAIGQNFRLFVPLIFYGRVIFVNDEALRDYTSLKKPYFAPPPMTKKKVFF
jgi:hypothetical protein